MLYLAYHTDSIYVMNSSNIGVNRPLVDSSCNSESDAQHCNVCHSKAIHCESSKVLSFVYHSREITLMFQVRSLSRAKKYLRGYNFIKVILERFWRQK